MPDNPTDKTPQEQSLKPRSGDTVMPRPDADLAPAAIDTAPIEPRSWLKTQLIYWGLAWQELQQLRIYRWMKASGKFAMLLLFTFFGLGVYQIVSWLSPLLPKLAWLAITLGIVVIAQELAIHFLGRFHERTVGELDSKHAGEIKAHDDERANIVASFREQIAELGHRHETELAKLRTSLDDERAKNADPVIKGEIQEVHVNRTLQMGVPDSEKRIDHYITIKVHLVNTSQRSTTIESFRLRVKTDKGEYEAIRTPLDVVVRERKERLTRTFIHASRVETVYEELPDLEKMNDILLDAGKGRKGWLRFVLSEDWMCEGATPESLTFIIRDAYGNSHLLHSDNSEWKRTGEIISKYEKENLQLLQELEEKTPRVEVARKLNEFIAEGDALLPKLAHLSNPPYDKAQEWEDRVMAYVRENFDELRFIAFSKKAGIRPYRGAAVNRTLVDWVNTLIERLGELLTDLGSR